MKWQLATNLRFEDLRVGQAATHSVKISDALIEAYAELTGDHHPLHTDKKYAGVHGFKDRIAHGALITSLSSKLIGMDLPGESTILLNQSSEYLKPVFPGDCLAFRATITHLKKSLRLVTVGIEVENQVSDIVSRQEFSIKIRELLP